MKTLTRNRVIQDLVDEDIRLFRNAISKESFIRSILLYGFTGYREYSNSELEKNYLETFNVSITIVD